MSKASHKKFLQKLYKELERESDVFRKSQANRRAHTFYVSVDMLAAQTEIELRKRKVRLNARDRDSILDYSERVIERLREKSAEIIRNTNKEDRVFRQIRTTSEEISLKFFADKDEVNIYGRLVSFYSDILKDEFQDLSEELGKHIPRKQGRKLEPENQETSGNSIVHAGHAKGKGVVELQIKEALNEAMKTNMVVAQKGSKELSRSQLLKDLKVLGIDLSMISTILDKNTQEINLYLESATENMDDGRFSGSQKNKLKNQIQRAIIRLDKSTPIAGLKGSDSYIDKTKKGLIDITIVPFKNKKGFDVTLESTKLIPSDKTKQTIKSKASGTIAKSNRKAKKLAKTRVRKRNTVPDIRSFIGILNSKINIQVAKNMASPRLNYRTGRFAESVRVTDILQTGQGFPSIGYTYMRYPYEVFEFPGTGHPLAQEGQRDPRSLIDKSIREIMAEFAIGRFYTRRV